MAMFFYAFLPNNIIFCDTSLLHRTLEWYHLLLLSRFLLELRDDADSVVAVGKIAKKKVQGVSFC